MSAFRQLIRELSRRGVIRTALAYCIAAYVVLQAIDMVLRLLLLPDWIFTLLAVVALIGLPVAVTVSWAFDWTPGEGFRRDLGSPEGGRAAGRAARAGLVVLVLIVSTGVGVVTWNRGIAPRIAAEATRSDGVEAVLDPGHLAVLYFEDRTPSGELDYLASGFTEALIHELTQVDRLEVVSPNGVKPFRDVDIAPDRIARELGVGTLIEGGIERVGERLRVTVQLVDGETGRQLLSRRIERPGENLLELRDEIAEEAAELLRRRLGEAIVLARRRSATSTSAAWRRMREGEQLREEGLELLESGDSAGGRNLLQAAEDALQAAVAADGGWTEPLVLLGWNTLTLGSIGKVDEVRVDARYLMTALEFARRAMELDPRDPGALELRGELRLRRWIAQDGSPEDTLLERAEADLRAAAARAANPASAYARLSEVLRWKGDFGGARAYAERAYEADAFLLSAEAVLGKLCHMSIELRELTVAERWCSEGRRKFPATRRFPEALLLLEASASDVPPDIERAWSLAAELEALAPRGERPQHRAVYHLYVAAALARTGLADSARSVIRRVMPSTDTAHMTPMLDYYAAHAYLRLGETEAALRHLATLVEEIPGYRRYLPSDWWFEDLHGNPEFLALVESASGHR